MRKIFFLVLIQQSAVNCFGQTKFNYDLDKPDITHQLRAVLNEISGLTDIDNDHIACVQDELGIVFIYNFRSGEMVSQHRYDSVGDFEGHQKGLQQRIGPMVMDCAPNYGYLYAIRFKASGTQYLVGAVQDLWKKSFPGYDFTYFFLDEDFEKQYQSEQRLANVFTLFAVVTIVIAAIGLIGLVSFMVVAKTKEIGIRKVLGAGVLNITRLLSREFIVLVIVANVLVIPLAWYFAGQWLNTFAYRTTVNPLLFLWTALIAVTITMVAVGYQTIRAASADPVKSLRYE